MKKLERIINIGFFVEVSLFVLSGYLLAKGMIIGLLVFGLGLWLALYVGEKIEKHGVNKYIDQKYNIKVQKTKKSKGVVQHVYTEI